jgi:4-amino-4-deoxy-L-arabinose transferase-like glycosyltransferase
MMASSAAVAVRPSDRLYRLLAGLFFLGIALLYYLPSLRWLPRGIHEWAQADRLAIALSFYDHGLHFFRPQTLNITSYDGIVGVEFPLMAYLAALGAKLLGRGALVPLYRALTISTAWLAYYYLFRLVFDRTRQFVAALVPGVFLAASPVFAYYAGNFMPDPASAALVLVALYYLLRYPSSRRFRDIAGAIAILTLATLTKLSGGIYLAAAFSILLLWVYLSPEVLRLRQRWLLLVLVALSVSLIVGYTLYTHYLNETYYSWVFLASPKPLKSFEQYNYMLMRVRRDWLAEYFVPFQYHVLKASVLVVGLSLVKIIRAEWLWAALLAISALGCLLFVWAMGTQFSDHDYYVLASFWPGLLLLVALATTQVAQHLAHTPRWLRHLLFGAVLLGLLVPGLRRYRARMSDPYLGFSAYYNYRWMQGGATQLAAAHVPSEATILVVGEEAPNLSLVYFDRRGAVWNPYLPQVTTSDVLRRMTEVGLDYLIMRQAVYQKLVQRQPDLLVAFSPVLSTPQYVALKRRSGPPHW